VTVKRSGRRSRIVLLKEDGSGDEYTRPTTKEDRWFTLPHSYWADGYDLSLSLPGKAMLLVALHLGDGRWLPANYTNQWFGISTATAERGLKELREAGLLDQSVEYQTDLRSPTGWATRISYKRAGSIAPKSTKPPTKKAAKALGAGKAVASKTTPERKRTTQPSTKKVARKTPRRRTT
jgi:hypothetical protein